MLANFGRLRRGVRSSDVVTQNRIGQRTKLGSVRLDRRFLGSARAGHGCG